MTRSVKGALLFAAAMLLVAGAAEAQSNCALCDPYGMCGVDCWTCSVLVDPEWGVCPEWAYSETTCGDYLGACNQYGCTPDWEITERVNVGSYGESTFGFMCSIYPFYCFPTSGCSHHLVDRVTETDQNQCNISSYYWQRTYCDDYIDFAEPQQVGPPPDCCDFPQYCNNWHSCF